MMPLKKKSSDQKNPPEDTLLLEIPAPRLSYKLAFLCGGAIFAVVTYMVGSVIYEAELVLAGQEFLKWEGIGHAASQIPHHLLTFIPWFIGTTGLAILLGYIFDKEVQYRRAAEALASMDSLTLLASRRVLMEAINREVTRAERRLSSSAFSLLMIDVDDFKKYNDSFGHVAGDQLLQNIASLVRGILRTSDVAGRYGGEEIMVLISGADKKGAAIVAERLRARIESHTDITVSIGVASYPTEGASVKELIRAADRAMYRAKEEGKNKVCMAEVFSE